MKIKLTQKEQDFIRNNLKNSDKLIEGELKALLIELDVLIVEKGLDENDEATDFYYEAQKFYDSIYQNNLE